LGLTARRNARGSPLSKVCLRPRQEETLVRVTTVLRKLLGVTGLWVEGVSFEEDGLVVEVRPSWRRRRCGQCGQRARVKDRRPSRRWRHLALGRIPIWLRYAPRRVACSSCGVVGEKVPWAAHNSRFTLEFEEMTAYLAQQMSQTAVRLLLGIDWRTVGSIVARVVQERLDPKRLEDLYVIGVDEISYRRHHHYLTVVVDHARRRVVWTGEGKSQTTLAAFFEELGAERSEQLTHVVMDMSEAYRSVVEEKAPQAEIVFDRFHVQRLASDAVDEVRRQQVRAHAGAGYAAILKYSRWALLKNPWDLTRREKDKLRDIEQNNQPLYRAYLLKEMLADCLDYHQPKRATEKLEQWLRWASRSRLKPFVKLARTIRRHKDRILAYVKTRLTNGLTEGLNNKVRLIMRRAFGFHSADAVMSMIHLCCGGIRLDPPLPSIRTESLTTHPHYFQ
jgi:transposase